MVRFLSGQKGCPEVKHLRYTLTSDGPSDRSLMAVIDWTLREKRRLNNVTIIRQFADSREPDSMAQRHTLSDRVEDAIQRFPCDILFIHRDAERESLDVRQGEIETAVSATLNAVEYWIPVIPVRMTEAWLLIDERAIRRAADNPNGSVSLSLPRVSRLERLPDPKATLNDLLIEASEKTGRRLVKFRRISELAWRHGRVADLIEDYSPLRSLSAFNAFENHVDHAINQLMTTM